MKANKEKKNINIFTFCTFTNGIVVKWLQTDNEYKKLPYTPTKHMRGRLAEDKARTNPNYLLFVAMGHHHQLHLGWAEGWKFRSFVVKLYATSSLPVCQQYTIVPMITFTKAVAMRCDGIGQQQSVPPLPPFSEINPKNNGAKKCGTKMRRLIQEREFANCIPLPPSDRL